MIRVKLIEPEIHRNECAFRPYVYAYEQLRDIGIELTIDADSYDFELIAQASFADKTKSIKESTNKGLEFLDKITGDYILLDAQDSTSLIGTYEVLKESNAVAMFKNSLLSDTSKYNEKWKLGRYYWGPGDYSIDDFDVYSDKIILSGVNWIATHWAGIKDNMQWYPISRLKKYDVSAMFQYPSLTDVYEHNMIQSKYYDSFREPAMNQLNKLNDSLIIGKLDNGKRVDIEEYYSILADSRITFAPYGYGEMAPRDLESAIFGSILLKPDMSYINTKPNIYKNNLTYIPCSHDFSDLAEKINMILEMSDAEFIDIIQNMRDQIKFEMKPEQIAYNIYVAFSKLNSIST